MHLDRQPQSYGKAFAQQLLKKKHNIEEFSDEMLLKSLKELPAKTLVENTTLFKDWDVANPMMWKPILDGDFMTMNFKDAIESGNFDKNIPIMTGCTSQEGLIFTTPFLKSPRRWTMLFNNWDHWAPLLLFNRETDLVTLDDITKTSLIKRKFFPAANENVPNMKGLHFNFFIVLTGNLFFSSRSVK